MKTAFHTALTLAGLLAAMAGQASMAQAQDARLINQCDRLCANNPRALCYSACLGGNGPSTLPSKAKRPQPVSVQSSSAGSWLDAVYASPSRAGPSGAGGGAGGGGGKK